jgi:outer membrane murein-binding lipoprotein Lpp
MNHIETKVLTAVIGILGSMSVWFMSDISSNMRELNSKVAVVFEKNSSLEKRVERVEFKIDEINHQNIGVKK